MLMNILMGVLIVLALIIIVLCTIVCGKNSQDVGGALGGGSSDTYFNKGGVKSKDEKLQLVMKVCSGLLVILSVVMVFLQK